jgi:hypothetical protein
VIVAIGINAGNGSDGVFCSCVGGVGADGLIVVRGGCFFHSRVDLSLV